MISCANDNKVTISIFEWGVSLKVVYNLSERETTESILKMKSTFLNRSVSSGPILNHCNDLVEFLPKSCSTRLFVGFVNLLMDFICANASKSSIETLLRAGKHWPMTKNV